MSSGRNRVWLGLGSNLGDSRKILLQAWQQLGESAHLQTLSLSPPYGSDPLGMESDNRFINAVGIFETSLDPHQLLTLLQEVERGFGRDKKTGADGYQDRLLDLDILYYADLVLSSGRLQLPHPHISARLFVLAPLAALDPTHCDPVSGLSAEEMHRQLLLQMESGRVALQQIQGEEWH